MTSMLILSTLSSFKPPSFLCSFIVINPANLPDMGYITTLTYKGVSHSSSARRLKQTEATIQTSNWVRPELGTRWVTEVRRWIYTTRKIKSLKLSNKQANYKHNYLLVVRR